MTQVALVIPARLGSTRFPRKPLVKVGGIAVIERVLRIARKVKGVSEVFVTTDSDEIEEYVKDLGASVIRTRPECSNGTERVWEAIQAVDPSSKYEIVLNLQGDAILTPPWVLEALVSAMTQNPAWEVSTPVLRLTWEAFHEFQAQKVAGKVSGTLAVVDRRGRALYFSKGVIPHLRVSEEKAGRSPYLRHIGTYAYRRSALKRWMLAPECELEKVEGLEQLRALHVGIPIQTVEVDYRGRTHASIDNPEDVTFCEKVLLREGELV